MSDAIVKSASKKATNITLSQEVLEEAKATLDRLFGAT